jgi:hypothetical protein
MVFYNYCFLGVILGWMEDLLDFSDLVRQVGSEFILVAWFSSGRGAGHTPDSLHKYTRFN